MMQTDGCICKLKKPMNKITVTRFYEPVYRLEGFFFERQIWITTRRRRHNAVGNPINMGKPPFVGIKPRTYWSQSLISPSRCH
ncbi:hypothetical protein Hdeb2414_s0003g00104561 [Helianthus debilis subsp. tardiflorus]